MSMFTVVEREAESPEVYRSTPFEHFSTAEAGQVVGVFATPILAGRTSVAQGQVSGLDPAVPSWIDVRLKNPRPAAQPVGPFELVLELLI